MLKVNPACAAQSLVVPDLINGQEYLFRIRAENRFGFGPYTETVEGAKARDQIRKLPLFSVLFGSLMVSSQSVIMHTHRNQDLHFFYYFVIHHSM